MNGQSDIKDIPEVILDDLKKATDLIEKAVKLLYIVNSFLKGKRFVLLDSKELQGEVSRILAGAKELDSMAFPEKS